MIRGVIMKWHKVALGLCLLTFGILLLKGSFMLMPNDSNAAMARTTSLQLGFTNQSFEDMNMSQRRTFVQRRCSEKKAWFKEAGHVTGQQMFQVDDRHRFMVCDLHKVGSHQLGSILQTINNETGNLFAYQDKLRRYISEEEARTSRHAKIMFVREPMERLLSSYIDNRSIRFVNETRVSFETFLKDVIASPIEKLDVHHQRFYDICQPCRIRYQFIGTLATFGSDINQIFHRSDFKRTDNNTSSNRGAFEKLKKYYNEVDPSVIHKVWEKFRVDYELFGYPYPSHLMS